MMAGLHGVGKTTTAGKLAHNLKKQARTRCLLLLMSIVRCYQTVADSGEQLGVKVFSMGDRQDGVAVCKAVMAAANTGGYDYVILTLW